MAALLLQAHRNASASRRRGRALYGTNAVPQRLRFGGDGAAEAPINSAAYAIRCGAFCHLFGTGRCFAPATAGNPSS